MQREPIFWTSTTPGYNAIDRETSVMKDGEEVIIRHPQSGHAGDSDYDNRRPARGLRFVEVVRHDGNVAPMVLTNAAAHMDPNTPFGQYMRAKASHYGWYEPGACPAALLAVGVLTPNKILDKSILVDQACAPGTYGPEHPCKHSRSELAARRAKKQQIERDRNANFKDPTDRMIEAGREQNRELATIIAEALAAKNSEPPPAPAPTGKAAK